MDENKVEKAVEEAVEAVKEKAEAVADKLDEVADAVDDKLDEVADAVADKLDEAADAVDDKLDKLEDAVAEKAEDVKEAVEGKVEEIKEAAKGKTRKAGVYHDPIKLMTEDSMKADKSNFIVGDTVKVHVRIKEGERSRIQVFEGTVIAMKHGGISETFTVRRTSYGVGVERVFPVNSPNVEKVEVVRHGKTRRAKLYFLRDRIGKAAKLKQKLDR